MANPSLTISYGEPLTLANVGPGILSANLVFTRLKTFVVSLMFSHDGKTSPLEVAGQTTLLPILTPTNTDLKKNGTMVPCFAEWNGQQFLLHVGDESVGAIPGDLQRFIAAVFRSTHVTPVIQPHPHPHSPHGSSHHKLSTGAIVGIAVGGGLLLAIIIILTVVLLKKKHNE